MVDDVSHPCPANTGGSGLSPGCSTRRSACGIVTMGAVRRQDDRDRELEVIAASGRRCTGGRFFVRAFGGVFAGWRSETMML